MSDCTYRPPITAPDPTETDFITSYRRNTNVPRAYFYLGAVQNQMRTKLPLLTESTSLTQPVTSSMEQFQSQEQTVE